MQSNSYHSNLNLLSCHLFNLQVILKIHEARTKLEGLGCFKGVDVLIDTYEGQDAIKEGIQVRGQGTEDWRTVPGKCLSRRMEEHTEEGTGLGKLFVSVVEEQL